MGITAIVAGLGLGASSAGLGIFGGANKPKLPDTPTPPQVGTPDDEQTAQKAAKKRRDLYANVGRSSTILTGPGGVEAAPTDGATPKQLLGL